MVKTLQFEITTTCLQVRYQATVQAALLGAHRARTGVLSLSKMVDGHLLDLGKTMGGLLRNLRALAVQARLLH